MFGSVCVILALVRTQWYCNIRDDISDLQSARRKLEYKVMLENRFKDFFGAKKDITGEIFHRLQNLQDARSELLTQLEMKNILESRLEGFFAEMIMS